jgi:hypothetical protein
MSQRKIQGAKRQEVIEKLLNGEDDPDWQVKETKTAGKYIISRRPPKDPEQEEEKEEQEPEKEVKEEDSDEEPEEKPKKPVQKVAKTPKPDPPSKPVKLPKVYPGKAGKPIFADDYAVEILSELRQIGELKNCQAGTEKVS